MSLDEPGPLRVLQIIDLTQTPHQFEKPIKKIHEGLDVSTFLVSKAYADIVTFLLQLNRSIVPRKNFDVDSQKDIIRSWTLNSESVVYSEPVRRLQQLLSRLESIIEEVPPDTGPRRFGNISFRKWVHQVESRALELLDECLSTVLIQSERNISAMSSAAEELKTYLIGSFGSGQRLDYGTGHELSFLAFLACLWKLNVFPRSAPGVEERGIVLGVIEPYLELVRKLIRTYNLEPAGSHGVWGLDDHFFVPYIVGSAQLAPPITESDQTPMEGSLDGSPPPSDVAKQVAVERERRHNMYFSAIGFIYDVKRGPFWEHSPMLYDISGITAGWGKINKGMIKMYNAEVLSKFPVVQHFPFGSLLSWDRDHSTPTPLPTMHTMSGADAILGGTRTSWANSGAPQALSSAGIPPTGTAAPWARPQPNLIGSNAKGAKTPTTSLPNRSNHPPGMMQSTRAPWATKSSNVASPGARAPAPEPNSSPSVPEPPLAQPPLAKHS